ncbi:DNA/RNA nuclease SfsA [Pseudomonas sp. N040]|uniref:DNA/RNA nuclease SfsA n=1 Tax=Pseudomonas sp. N040 TaxID=2785325 RepID=UPI0018A309BC|nr:DNA/RNA nuclease SfsA [Pseudomonas sp. N040]MBF7729600.1 DNA/RNA nuclease SfsA [Pseudomonas sp. N040]MBW7013240.1 DNA/RNA nuclease SfsA [Pseudomonas sp. N040]
MQFDPPLEEARLLQRYKRFLADVETAAGERLTLHCPNTGSMLNCMSPGGRIWFSRSSNPQRKLPGTWELAQTPQGRLACINTARANPLVEEALLAGVIGELAGFTALRREVRFGEENSRIDFVLEFPAGPVFVEVKSVTLGFADSPVAAFPDARSERASKHLRELTRLARNGVRAVQLYCVNLSGVEAVRAAAEIDPQYARALAEARQAGVQVLAYAVQLSVNSLHLSHALPVLAAH